MLNSIFLLPVGAVLITIFSMNSPDILASQTSQIIPLLGLVMFIMGLSLKLEDFKRVAKRPSVILLGISIQYLLMPFYAWLLGQFPGVEHMLLVGLVLVGASPGGVASNVVCYLAKGDVALSISLTAVATLCAVFLTPFFTWLYIGESIDVPLQKMMLSIVKIILLPVGIGLIVNHFCKEKLVKFQSVFSQIASLAIILIIGIIVAKTSADLKTLGVSIVLIVVLHNLLGLLSGYFIPALLGYDEKTCKTIAIETGMQNSGLGVALANQFFSATAALPGAFFSVWHNISGASLAAYWARKNNNND